MGGDEMLETENLGHRLLKPEEGARAGVRFITLHHRSPLSVAQRTGAGIGEEIDEDIVGAKPEDIEACRCQCSFTFLTADPPDRFNSFNPERFRWIGPHKCLRALIFMLFSGSLILGCCLPGFRSSR